jgi:hypothetical protein
MKQSLNEFKRMQQLAGVLNENDVSDIQKFIDDKDFIKSFIANARLAYRQSGDYQDMFWLFKEDGLTEEQIGDLLEYLVKIKKLK